MAIDTTKARSRRTLLAGTVSGLVALAASALGRPQPVRADGQAILVGGEYDTAVSKTSLRNKANAAVVFQASSDSFGIGVQGSSGTGIGVHGTSTSYYGVHGSSSSGQGVYGFSSTSAGIDGFSNSAAGARGLSNLNTGVLGISYAPNGVDIAGVMGIASGGLGTRPVGVWGRSSNNAGVFGESPEGRGGRFKGKKAQIRLHPSTDATHPTSGSAGDLFVDASKRLWFCKGGTSWVRLDD